MGLPNNLGKLSNMITSTGSAVGIGTSSPNSILEIKTSTATNSIRLGVIADDNRFNMISLNGLNTEGNYIGLAGGGSTDTNLFYQSGNGGDHRFRTGNGSAFIERMRITSSGNVGIGTSSYNYRLAVYNSSDGTTAAFGGTGYGIRIDNGGTFSSGMTTIFGVDNSFYGSYQPLRLSASTLIFAYSNTEAMRITSGGSVCINSTSPLNANAKLNINGELWMGNMTAGAGNSTLKYNTGTGLVTFDSSARIFKKDITDLEYGLDAVLKMSSKKYKWKSNNQEDLGFIADEMYKVVPEVVYLADSSINETELEDGEPMGINYDRLVPVLVKAIQELNAKVTALENK